MRLVLMHPRCRRNLRNPSPVAGANAPIKWPVASREWLPCSLDQGPGARLKCKPKPSRRSWTMLEDYFKHAQERAALGIPPQPLTPDQTGEVCRLLENPPQDKAGLL